MTRKEVLTIENSFLDEVKDAIAEGREFTETEQKYFNAFEAVQDLRKALCGGGNDGDKV